MKKLLYTLLVLAFGLLIFTWVKPAPEHHVSELINTRDVVKMSQRSSGNGQLYTITDRAAIEQFFQILDHAKLTEARSEPVTGTSGLQLFDAENREIGGVMFLGWGMVNINGQDYRMSPDISVDLADFWKEFHSEKNQAKE